jgi:DNA topoisomerase-2
MHKDENLYVPTMIFGHLLTSSNFNDDEEKVTGGRNGYGAKLCNVFSTKFTVKSIWIIHYCSRSSKFYFIVFLKVETSSKAETSEFKQSWNNNMSKADEPKIKPSRGDDFTRITFQPDLSKFGMERLDDDTVALLSRRAYDIAASCKGVKVFLNSKRVQVKSFKVELF